jgi:hypothetical protein
VTFVVLLILAIVWALYLASWLRSRAQIRTANTVSSFNQHLSVLERARPAGVEVTPFRPVGGASLVRSAAPRPHDPLVRPPQVRGLLSGSPITVTDAQRRRRDVLVVLSFAAIFSFVPLILLGGVFSYITVGFCSVLATYVFLLVRAQKLMEERQEKVRYLPTADFYEYEPAFATSH